jgi:tetratricopeptide (TPR) repeat protein
MNEPELDARLHKANALIIVGDFVTAKTLLAETTTIYPESAQAWKELGVVEDKLENNEVSERHLLRSLHLDDSDSDTWSVLGGVYFYNLARYDDASRCFRRSLAIDPANTYALMNYLTIAAVTGAADAPLGVYSAALRDGELRCAAQIEQNVDIPWSYYDLGQILFFEGRYDECRSAIRQGFARSSDWQMKSARLPYEQLTRAARFTGHARAVLSEFPSMERIG